MNVVVVGGGKVGFYLASTLLEHGHHPVVIELERQVCHHLADRLDIPVVCGDGTELQVLEEACSVAPAEAVIGVSGRDEVNLIVCQLAKLRFSVPKTVARVNNPRNMEVLQKLGVDICVSSTSNIVNVLEHQIDTAAIRQLMALNRGEFSLNELELPEDFRFSGKTLTEIRMPQSAVLVSISRGEEFLIPRGNTKLLAGDRVVLIAKTSSLHELAAFFGINHESFH